MQRAAPSSRNGVGRGKTIHFVDARPPKWRRVSMRRASSWITTQRAPSSQNGGGYRCDARPPPKKEEDIDATRPSPEMEEGIDATLALLQKWRRVSTRRAPSSRNGIAAPRRRRRHCPPTHQGGRRGECLRQGIRPGELCLREVAAFLLDRDGFSSVPMTTLTEARHPVLYVAGTRWTLSKGVAGVGVHSLVAHPSPGLVLSSANGTRNTTSLSPVLSAAQEPAKKDGSFVLC